MSTRVGVKIKKFYLIIFDDRIGWKLWEKGMCGKFYRVGSIVFSKGKFGNCSSFPYTYHFIRAAGIGDQAVKTE